MCKFYDYIVYFKNVIILIEKFLDVMWKICYIGDVRL